MLVSCDDISSPYAGQSVSFVFFPLVLALCALGHKNNAAIQ